MNKESLKLDYNKAYLKGVKLLESKKYYDTKVGLFILIGIQTGLRSIDLLNLNKSQIEFKNNGAVINYTAKKTDKSGQAFIDTKISNAIKNTNRDDVFFNEIMNVPFSHTWINRRLKTIFASEYKSAIKQGMTLGVHSLRKTSGSYIYNKYGVETARELLQHSGYNVTVAYLKETKENHLNKLENLFA
jgi:integrase